MALEIPERPRLAGVARVRYDSVRKSHVLLLPERVVLLGESSAEILELCDGARTVADVIAELRSRYPGIELENDVREFLMEAVQRKWLEPPART